MTQAMKSTQYLNGFRRCILNQSDLYKMRDSGDITGLLEALNEKDLTIQVFADDCLADLGE